VIGRSTSVTIAPVVTNEWQDARLSQRELEWAQWMRAAVAGDTAAYDRLLHGLARALRPIVRRGLASAGRGASEVEDIVQEVLLAVHLKRYTWDTARPIGPWVGAIARYKVIDALRRRGGRDEVPIDLFADSIPAPDERPAMSERDIDRHLDRLSPNQRAVVRSIAIEGASIAETADRLEMTQGAVRVALHRALVALAKAQTT
jgi:RNA polymerase sigma-70 factor (ECF subfamily)